MVPPLSELIPLVQAAKNFQLFTSLYSMLPTSQKYLTRAGLAPSLAAYTLIGLFLAGVIIIRFLSALLHHYIPSHVVDCAHSHEPQPASDLEHGHHDHHDHHPTPAQPTRGSTERTPLLTRSHKSTPAVVPLARSEEDTERTQFRESWHGRLVRRVSRLMGGVKAQCDDYGPCYGISQACGHECSKTLVGPGEESLRPAVPRSVSVPVQQDADRLVFPATDLSATQQIPKQKANAASSSSSHTGLPEDYSSNADAEDVKSLPAGSGQHHHHVPQNAFLSIGLQTSVAIALHKLPEGFITYATNHASPTLGLTVFLALFIHNISEGFAMALPLYLALHSRAKAMFWSSLLGGISQPAGAALAALWIWSARHTGGPGDDGAGPSWGVYGGMFAATAGVMTSVALQLFSEGLALTHRRGMCIGFAIGGMGLMGLSFALTA